MKADEMLPLRSTLILNILLKSVLTKTSLLGELFRLEILFSLERSLSFVRITKSCRRHHLTSSNSLPSLRMEEEEIGLNVYTA